MSQLYIYLPLLLGHSGNGHVLDNRVSVSALNEGQEEQEQNVTPETLPLSGIGQFSEFFSEVCPETRTA